MIATLQYNSKKLKIDLSEPLDISIAIKNSNDTVNAWYIGSPKIEPVVLEDKVISIDAGAAVNFNTITFNPHAHGTHTESVGHIVKDNYAINRQLKQFFFLAEVVTVAPEKHNEDYIISAKQLQFLLGNKKREAVVVRTIPNTRDKVTKQYSHTNWPYFTEDAIKLLVKKGIKHLLVDVPSVDKENDGGELKAHHAFWNTKGMIRAEATITEFVYVSNNIKDGIYILNLQVASFENDAAPSRPILYEVVE